MAKPSNINHLFKISEKTADLFSRRESFFLLCSDQTARPYFVFSIPFEHFFYL